MSCPLPATSLSCVVNQYSERTGSVLGRAVNRNGDLHVAQLDMPIVVAKIDNCSPLEHACPVHATRGIRRRRDDRTGARDQVRGLLAQYEREFPREQSTLPHPPAPHPSTTHPSAPHSCSGRMERSGELCGPQGWSRPWPEQKPQKREVGEHVGTRRSDIDGDRILS